MRPAGVFPGHSRPPSAVGSGSAALGLPRQTRFFKFRARRSCVPRTWTPWARASALRGGRGTACGLLPGRGSPLRAVPYVGEMGRRESRNPEIRHSPSRLPGAQDRPGLRDPESTAEEETLVRTPGLSVSLGQCRAGHGSALAACSQLRAPSSARRGPVPAGAGSPSSHHPACFVSIWLLTAACETQFKNGLCGPAVQPWACSSELSVRTGCVTDGTAAGDTPGAPDASATAGAVATCWT